jgi:rRNA maturation RNase YbeY
MINFVFQDIKEFKLSKISFKKQIKDLILHENCTLGDISFVFCSDDYLLEINKTYLNHDYYTDIISFDFCENKKISGDLMLSIDRIKENALLNKVTFEHELKRIMFHGVLHLCGYKDKTKADKSFMTKKENFYLEMFLQFVSRGTNC